MRVASYCNSVVQYVIAKVRGLKALLVAIYCSPDTRDNKWKEATKNLTDDIHLTQANGQYERIIFGGYLNFGNINWDENGNVIFGSGLSNQAHEFVKLPNYLSAKLSLVQFGCKTM